jgi:hypothetical protein
MSVDASGDPVQDVAGVSLRSSVVCIVAQIPAKVLTGPAEIPAPATT